MAFLGNCIGIIEHNWERPTFNKQLNKTTMDKSKFKSVKFKPTDRYLSPDFNMGWQDVTYEFKVSFTEQYIEAHPELFEVEKAERAFEHKGYYKVKINSLVKEYEPAQYNGHTKGFYIINSEDKYLQRQIFEIGERIEL